MIHHRNRKSFRKTRRARRRLLSQNMTPTTGSARGVWLLRSAAAGCGRRLRAGEAAAAATATTAGAAPASTRLRSTAIPGRWAARPVTPRAATRCWLAVASSPRLPVPQSAMLPAGRSRALSHTAGKAASSEPKPSSDRGGGGGGEAATPRPAFVHPISQVVLDQLGHVAPPWFDRELVVSPSPPILALFPDRTVPLVLHSPDGSVPAGHTHGRRFYRNHDQCAILGPDVTHRRPLRPPTIDSVATTVRPLRPQFVRAQTRRCTQRP